MLINNTRDSTSLKLILCTIEVMQIFLILVVTLHIHKYIFLSNPLLLDTLLT